MEQFLKGKPEFIGLAPIDLKDAILYIRDGFDNGTNTPTTTDIEPIDETDIALSDMDDTVPVGAGVKFGTDTTEYSVTARSLGTGTNEVQTLTMTGSPTGGTFKLGFGTGTTEAIDYDATAAEVELALEALDTIPQGEATVAGGPFPGTAMTVTFTGTLGSKDVAMITLDDNSLTGGTTPDVNIVETTKGVVDGSTTQITISPGLKVATTASGSVTFMGQKVEIKIGEGNLTYTENKPREYRKNRGLLETVRDADEEPMDVSFDFIWDWITGVTGTDVPTIEDCLKQRGEASDWKTTSADACEPYCCDLEFHYDPECGGTNSEIVQLEQFRYESLDHNASDAQITCTGKCNKTEATATRGT